VISILACSPNCKVGDFRSDDRMPAQPSRGSAKTLDYISVSAKRKAAHRAFWAGTFAPRAGRILIGSQSLGSFKPTRSPGNGYRSKAEERIGLATVTELLNAKSRG